MRRLVSVLVTVAFLLASAGVGNALPAAGPHDHRGESAALQIEPCSAGMSHVSDCAASAAQQDHGRPAKLLGFDSCCVVACSPVITAAVGTEAGVLNITVIRLAFRVDQISDSNSPDGLFRPPRPQA